MEIDVCSWELEHPVFFGGAIFTMSKKILYHPNLMSLFHFSSIFKALKKVYELFGGTITAKGHNVTRLSLWHTLPMHLIPLSLFQLLCWWTQCEILLVRWGFWLEFIPFIISLFYRTRVRSLVMLVTHSLTHSLTDWLPFSKLESDDCLLTDGLTD